MQIFIKSDAAIFPLFSIPNVSAPRNSILTSVNNVNKNIIQTPCKRESVDISGSSVVKKSVVSSESANSNKTPPQESLQDGPLSSRPFIISEPMGSFRYNNKNKSPFVYSPPLFLHVHSISESPLHPLHRII